MTLEQTVFTRVRLRLIPFMFLLYIPLGFITDKAIFNYRVRRKAGSR